MAMSAAMSVVECTRCGATVNAGENCPVCEHPAGAPSGAPVTELDERPAARWWRSGQLPLGIAAACLLVSVMLPLLTGLALREDGVVTPDVSVRPWDLMMGTHAALKGRMTAWFLPGAALFILSMLRSRRTAPAMMAARPLVVVVALAPAVSVAMPFLRLHRMGVSPTPGAAMGLVGLAVVLGVVGALRFGTGAPEFLARPGDDD